VILKPGDVYIGRGNNHAWFNHGTVPCRSVTLMLDGKPKREGSISGMQQQREPDRYTRTDWLSPTRPDSFFSALRAGFRPAYDMRLSHARGFCIGKGHDTPEEG